MTRDDPAERVVNADSWSHLVRVMRARPFVNAFGLVALLTLTIFLLSREANTKIIETGERTQGVVVDMRERSRRGGRTTHELFYRYPLDRLSDGGAKRMSDVDKAVVSRKFFDAHDIGKPITVFVITADGERQSAVEDNGDVVALSRRVGWGFALLLLTISILVGRAFATRQRPRATQGAIH